VLAVAYRSLEEGARGLLTAGDLDDDVDGRIVDHVCGLDREQSRGQRHSARLQRLTHQNPAQPKLHSGAPAQGVPPVEQACRHLGAHRPKTDQADVQRAVVHGAYSPGHDHLPA